MLRLDDDLPTPESPRWFRGAALLACAVVMVLRSPGLLLVPRMWAEEATIYYVYARHHDLLPSLFLVPSSRGPAGYMSLIPNAASTLASRLLSEEWAPALLTLVAFAVQLVPLALVLWGRSWLWNTARQRLAVCALLLFCSTVIAEVWLNTINSQIFCGLAAAVLLMERLEGLSRLRRWLYRGVLAVAGLTGLYTVFLGPAFVLRAWQTRHREAWRQAGIVALCALVQALGFVATTIVHRPGRDRFVSLDLFKTAATVLEHHVLRAILGQRWGAWLAEVSGLATGGWMGAVALLALVSLVGWLAWRAPRWRWPLIAGYATLLVLVSPSTNPSPPIDRYAALSGLLLLLNLWAQTQEPRRWRRQVSRGLLVVALIAGIGDFRREIPFAALGLEAEGPRWSDEVALWRQNPDYMPRLWPFDWARSWRVYLPQPGEQGSFEDPITLQGPQRLISTGDWAEASFELPGLEGDFLLVIFFEASQDNEQVELELRLQTDDGTTVSEAPILDFAPGEPARAIVERRSLRRRGGASFDTVRHLTFAARALGSTPIRVTIDRVHLGPRIQGTYETYLPHLSLPSHLEAVPSPPPATPALLPGARLSTSPSRLAAQVLGSSGPGLLHLLALGLLGAQLRRTSVETATVLRLGLILALLLLSVFPGWIWVAESPLVLALALLWALDGWLTPRDVEDRRKVLLGWAARGFVVGMAVLEQALLAPLLAVVALDLGRDRRWRDLGATTLGVGLATLAQWATVADPSSVAARAEPVLWVDSAASWLRGLGWLFWGREGWAPLYPGALVAVVLFALTVDDRRRLLLFAALTTSLALLAGVEHCGSVGSLGAVELAILFPLFLRLPHRWPPLRRWLAIPLLATLLWSFPATQALWHQADPESVPPPRDGGLRLLASGPTSPPGPVVETRNRQRYDSALTFPIESVLLD